MTYIVFVADGTAVDSQTLLLHLVQERRWYVPGCTVYGYPAAIWMANEVANYKSTGECPHMLQYPQMQINV